MKDVLVISRGTAQARSFEKFMDEYTRKNNLPIRWIYATDKDYLNQVEANEVKVAIISPEVVMFEAAIKAQLEAKGVKYIIIKPAAFGLKQTEKFMPDVLKYIEE